MRIIGQVAGHEINLEIEDVLDKIKINVPCVKNKEMSKKRAPLVVLK